MQDTLADGLFDFRLGPNQFLLGLIDGEAGQDPMGTAVGPDLDSSRSHFAYLGPIQEEPAVC